MKSFGPSSLDPQPTVKIVHKSVDKILSNPASCPFRTVNRNLTHEDHHPVGGVLDAFFGRSHFGSTICLKELRRAIEDGDAGQDALLSSPFIRPSSHGTMPEDSVWGRH